MSKKKPKKRKTLIARFDVTALRQKEINQLGFYVHVQSEGADDDQGPGTGYRSVPGPDIVTIDEDVPASYAELSAIIRDTFLEGRDQEAMALLGELVNTEATRKALAELLAGWKYDTNWYEEETLGDRVHSPNGPDSPGSQLYKLAEQVIALVFRGE
jgi:hypothetical protein